MNGDAEFARRLDQAIGLLAVIALKDLGQREQIELLDRLGFRPRDIADLVGTSANSVRVRLVEIRRRRKRKI